MDFLFNPTILRVAKDAGIPICVLVGVLAIFVVIAAARSDMERSRFFAVALFGSLSVVSLLVILWFSTRDIYQWTDTKALADWSGQDEGWTDGREPMPQYCDRSREGTLAVCWSNRRKDYPTDPTPMFRGTSGNGAWCTYKMKETVALNAPDGKNPGRLFVCARVSI